MTVSAAVYRPSYLLIASRLAFVAALAALSIGSVLPQDYVPPHPMQDKVLHFLGYGLVAALAMLAIRNPGRRVGCLVALTLLGISLEVAQIFVPGRAFELWDMAANGCGVFFAFQIMRAVLV